MVDDYRDPVLKYDDNSVLVLKALDLCTSVRLHGLNLLHTVVHFQHHIIFAYWTL